MTNPLPVSIEAREAAARQARDMFIMPDPVAASEILAGKWDDLPRVQAFAAFEQDILARSGGEQVQPAVETVVRQKSPVVADYDECFLVAHVSKDGSLVGIDHPCDAVWEDVMRAHVALRDRINERIEAQDGCPFSPAQRSLSSPPDADVERVARAIRFAQNERKSPGYGHVYDEAPLLPHQIDDARAAIAALRSQPDVAGLVEALEGEALMHFRSFIAGVAYRHNWSEEDKSAAFKMAAETLQKSFQARAALSRMEEQG